jgi:hypothetical protein
MRHSPKAHLEQPGRYDLSDPDQREKALDAVFPLDNLCQGNEAINMMSRSKMHFLQSGRLLIPEAREVNTLISGLRDQFQILYNVLDLTKDLERQRDELAWRLGGSDFTITASVPLYSPCNKEDLYNHSTRILEDVRSLQGHLSSLCVDNEEYDLAPEYFGLPIEYLESSLALLQVCEYPDYSVVHRQFAQAIKSGLKRRIVMPSTDRV